MFGLKSTGITGQTGILYFDLSLFILLSLSILSKPEAQTDSSVSAERAKSVFVIIVVEQIFNGGKNSRVKSFAFQRNIVTAGQIGAAIAVKAKNTRRKTERREITARGEKIEIHPSAAKSLRRNQRKLMFRNTERFDNAGCRNL